MKRPRTRARGLLLILGVLVLLLAVSRYAIVSAPHWSSCQQKADEHAEMVNIIAGFISNGARIVPAYDDGPPATAQELLDYHIKLRNKYRLAAWYPWKLIEPDPPVPIRKE